MPVTDFDSAVDLTDLLGYRVVDDPNGDPDLFDRDGRPVDTSRQAHPYDRAGAPPGRRA